MKKLLVLVMAVVAGLQTQAQPAGALSAQNDNNRRVIVRKQQYEPDGNAFVCENGTNRFTRALYSGHSGYRIETSDRPVFAIVKKGMTRSVRFEVEGVMLDDATYCWSKYANGIRNYVLVDKRWEQYGRGVVRVNVVALHKEEGVIFQFIGDHWNGPLKVNVRLCDIANSKFKRNGDLGVDDPASFEPAPGEAGLTVGRATNSMNFAHTVIKGKDIFAVGDISAFKMFEDEKNYYNELAGRLQFFTPDAYINTLGGALAIAANADWDGQTWLHGCIGWRMPLAGWRAAYVGDALGWGDRAKSHFTAYAKSQVTNVPPTIAHPSQDAQQNLARAEKRWGTQMYSDGYICRNPERNDQMHHYDMNLNYIDELLWHFQYDADPAYMRQMWPVIKRHLAWEKRNFDPDGDHLYDAYCCIWASDALYYSGGAVTHSSAYNYRANHLAARIAEILGEDGTPYRQEAYAILKAMNERLWMPSKGHWAEYQDAMGLKRLHESAAVWSVYTPIDCGACTPEQAYQATEYIDRESPHLPVSNKGYYTIATTNWLPYAWSINNVAPAEVMHTALAYFEAGRPDEGFRLLKGNVLDNMYYGQSPANFGQLSQLDAARGECYRDFGDCIGISARALLQGLFGIIPQALYGQCILRPGFPQEWDSATVRTPYLAYKYVRIGGKDRYEISQNFPQPLKVIVRQNLGGGKYRDIEGNADRYQVIEVPSAPRFAAPKVQYDKQKGHRTMTTMAAGTADPLHNKSFRKLNIDNYFNANVSDIFKNQYLSPRPQTTTLQIPVQGVGEWCHPDYCPTIDDTMFRSMAKGNEFTVAGVPFRTPQRGRNVIFTSLWQNYPEAIVLPLQGKAGSAYLLMTGTTNHMQSRIDNGLVIATYLDGSTDTLHLRNPENWCPIEQDYFIDQQAFHTTVLRPYRVCFSNGTVSRDLGSALGLQGVYGREIPGGAAQMLRMPLNKRKKLVALTVRALSNDVVIGLMGVTLQ